MASFKSSQGVSILLVALLVCQAFTVPSLARTQFVTEANKLAEPQVMSTPQGRSAHGHGDNSGHGHGEDKEHGGPEYGGHKYRGHGNNNGGHDEAGHNGGHG